MKYRMYIDEVGYASHKNCADEQYRYLSLTGVIIDLAYVKETVAPSLENMKRHLFDPHPDEAVILHRNDIVRKRPPFECLFDPEKRREFDHLLLSLLGELTYSVVTVIIDKQEQLDRYTVWQHDPYHYAMQVLLERYVKWLESEKAKGDVLAESRGGREDQRLMRAFARIWNEGTDYMGDERFKAALSSKELKVKLKANNIAGLQIADLLAYPSRQALLKARKGEQLTDTFGTRIVEILNESKYLRSPTGSIRGWGTKWLP